MDKAFVQLGAVAGVGAVFAISKLVTRPKIHEVVRKRPKIVSREPHLASIVSEFAAFTNGAGIDALLDDLEKIIEYTQTKKKANQWLIARLNGDILRKAHKLCQMEMSAFAGVDTNTEAYFDKLLLAKDELLPKFEGRLDDLLHNYILDT